jgi:hypothetical protein
LADIVEEKLEEREERGHRSAHSLCETQIFSPGLFFVAFLHLFSLSYWLNCALATTTTSLGGYSRKRGAVRRESSFFKAEDVLLAVQVLAVAMRGRLTVEELALPILSHDISSEREDEGKSIGESKGERGKGNS